MDNRKQEHSLNLNKEKSLYVFTEYIQIETYDPESVRLNFAIKDTPESATVSHTVIMTIPHFIRFAEVCGNVSKEIRMKLEELKKKQQ